MVEAVKSVTSEREKINRNPKAHYVLVSDEFASDMLGSVPPVYLGNRAGYSTFQVGEVADHIDGVPHYETYTKMRQEAIDHGFRDKNMVVNKWYYMGIHPVIIDRYGKQ